MRRGGSGRRVLLLACAGFVLLAAYGSWVPLRIAALDAPTAAARFREILARPLRVESRSDWATNIALFVPIGFCGTGALAGTSRPRLYGLLALPAVCAACLALGAILEFGQLWIVTRVCSQNDIAAQSIGGLLGAAGWVATGPWVAPRLAGRTVSAAGIRDRLVWILELYLLAAWCSLLLPFDLTIRPAELYDKYQAGGIQLLPLADLSLTTEGLLSLIGDVLLYVSLGVVLSIRGVKAGQIRSLGIVLLLGGLLVCLVEASQIFVQSRYCSATDVLAGLGGVFAGWGLAHSCSRPNSVAATAGREESGSLPWVVAAFAYGIFVAALLCAPFQLVATSRDAADRAGWLFSYPPFTVLYAGTIEHAVSEILRKLLLFAPLGGLAGMAMHSARLSTGEWRRRLLAAWLLIGTAALGIELLQVFFPPHVPDLGDMLLSAVGAGLGILAVEWIWRERLPVAVAAIQIGGPPAAGDSSLNSDLVQ